MSDTKIVDTSLRRNSRNVLEDQQDDGELKGGKDTMSPMNCREKPTKLVRILDNSEYK